MKAADSRKRERENLERVVVRSMKVYNHTKKTYDLYIGQGNTEIREDDLGLMNRQDLLTYQKAYNDLRPKHDELLLPLEKYVSEGWWRHFRTQGSQFSTSLRGSLVKLTLCDRDELEKKVKALKQSIQAEKSKLKDQGGYYKALDAVANNIDTYCQDMLSKAPKRTLQG